MINTLPPEILIPIIHDVLLYTVSTANGHIGDFSSMVLSSMEEPIWGPTVDLDETDNPYALATLGPLWQSGIESLTFSKLVLTPDRVREALAGHYLSPRRLSYVRRIDYSIPIAVNKGPAASDTTDSDAFTAGVADLLRLIGGPPQLIPSADPHIQLNISIPMDHTIFVNTESVNKLDLLGKARVEASMIAEGHLRVSHIEMNEGVLATVPNIPTVAQMFIKSHSNSLLIVPRSAVLIAAKATRLRHVRLHLDDNEKRDAALRIKLRNGLADSLGLLSASLRVFDLQYLRLQPNDQEYEPSSIIPEGETEDRLTRTLSLFSGRGGLQVFWVVGSVEPTILTPRGNDGPFWASMRSFHVRLSPVTPSGRWLTAIGPSAPALRTDHIQRHQAPLEIGVPGESILNKCRGRADQEAMVEIAVWSARCARCMPALQNFQVLVDSDRLNREENPLWIWYSLTRDTDNTLVQDRSQVQIKSYPRMVGLEQVVAEWQQTTEFHDMLLEMVITSFDFQPAIRYSRGRLL